MTTPRVSILIPTLDGASDLERLLPALARQRFEGGVELRAIDSSSSDDTVARLRAAGATVEVVPRAARHPSGTRRCLARGARGELLLFLRQGAVPRDDGFIATLAAAFERDPRLAGASANVAADASDVLTRPGAVDDAGPRFDGVAEMLRASALREVPFPEVPFGEDFAWAAQVLARGWRVARVDDAVVLHTRPSGRPAAEERAPDDARSPAQGLADVVRPSVRSAARGVLAELRQDARHARARGASLRRLLRAPGRRAAEVLGPHPGNHRDPATGAPPRPAGERRHEDTSPPREDER